VVGRSCQQSWRIVCHMAIVSQETGRLSLIKRLAHRITARHLWRVRRKDVKTRLNDMERCCGCGRVT
jgi:nicotinamide riboside kinase